jgi:hypothetical protein
MDRHINIDGTPESGGERPNVDPKEEGGKDEGLGG